MNWYWVAALRNMTANIVNQNISNEIKNLIADSISVPKDLKAVAEKLIVLPSIASKRWIYNQYDSMVGTANASTNAPTDAAIVLVKGTKKGLR